MFELEDKTVELFKFIDDNQKGHAGDILASLYLLRDSIRETRAAFHREIRLHTEDYDRLGVLVPRLKSVREIETAVDQVIGVFEEARTTPDDDDDDEPKDIPNYEDYVVNRNVEHTLLERFKHKKICAIRISDEKYDVADWKTALIKVCEVLFKKDQSKFREIVDSQKYKGSRIKYLVRYPVDDENHYYRPIPGSAFYVWTNQSADAICEIMRKLIDEYKIPLNSVRVYLRADYTALHIKETEEDSEELPVSEPKPKETEPPKKVKHIPPFERDDLPIGKYVRYIMRTLSNHNYMFDVKVIDSLLDKEETQRIFGPRTSYPFFAEVMPGENPDMVMRDSSGRSRYWNEVFQFNDRKFLVSSQWYAEQRDAFNEWVESLSSVMDFIM